MSMTGLAEVQFLPTAFVVVWFFKSEFILHFVFLPTLATQLSSQISRRGLGGSPKSTVYLVLDWACGGSNPSDGMGVS
jgi:hypothetical protein